MKYIQCQEHPNVGHVLYDGEVLPECCRAVFIGTPVFIISSTELAARYPKTCTHAWEAYTGLIESYDYCTKCDEKKDA